MRPRFAGRQTAPKRHFGAALAATAAAVALCLAVPSFRSLAQKEATRKTDRVVGLSVDWDDIRAFVPPEKIPAFLQALRDIPISILNVRDDLGAVDESTFRAMGFTFLWKLHDGADSNRFPKRLGAGDGVMVTGEYALESPGMAEAIAAAVRRQSGFLAVMEFSPSRALLHLPILLRDRLLRTHFITTRETVWPKPALWNARLDRAVRDRWVRLVCVRFSSSWTADVNLDFVRKTAERFRDNGFEVGTPAPISPWRMPFENSALAALLLAALAPAAAIALLSRPGLRGVLVPFTMATLWCALAGVIVHGLVASPAAAAGAASARGVKLQLVLPILLSALVLLRSDEVMAFFRRPATWGDLSLAALVVGVGLVVYLMRSGNDPLIPASDAERSLRDGLEHLLGARPRFKEFAMGHPLLIAGLFMRGRGVGFFRDGRALLLAGVIGQISVVNTFIHAPAPLYESLLRTFHGWWIGALVSLPLCHALNRYLPAKSE